MKLLKGFGITVVSIIMIIVAVIFIVQGYQNTAISMEERVGTAKADINVQEKARFDKVYNLADCVKQYDKHEAETLIAVVEGRSGSGADIENASTMIAAVAEAYPELKSDQNYQKIMNELIIIENLIAEYRSNYNKTVEQYNTYIRKFPQRQMLDFLGYEKKSFEKLNYEAPVDAPVNLFD